MKKSLLVIGPVLLLVAASAGYLILKRSSMDRNTRSVTPGCEAIDISAVQREARQIEAAITQYTATPKEVQGKSTEGGLQTDYSMDGKVVLIKQTLFGETGRSDISYFIHDARVFYFTKNNAKYVLPLTEDPSGKVKSVESNEFYLGPQQTLCSWVSNGQLQENTQAARDTVTFLLRDLQ